MVLLRVLDVSAHARDEMATGTTGMVPQTQWRPIRAGHDRAFVWYHGQHESILRGDWCGRLVVCVSVGHSKFLAQHLASVCRISFSRTRPFTPSALSSSVT